MRPVVFPAAFVALALTACDSTDRTSFPLAAIDAPASLFIAKGARPFAEEVVYAATTEGLVGFDEQGRVVPALADRWIVTDDGLSYIFRIRDGNWRSGSELTARSIKASFDRAVRAQRGTAFGLDLSGIDEVRVMAGRVIEIRLLRAMPYLLQLLAQPELGLSHEDAGAGPMQAEIAEAQDVNLRPIEPSRLGLPEAEDWAERTRRIELLRRPAAEAVALFNEGKVDLVLGGRIEDFPLTRSVGILRGTIQIDPVGGLFGLRVMRDEGFLSAPENREALAMALDRPALLEPFSVGGWTPTTRIVAPGLEDDSGLIDERWPDVPLEERRRVAAERVSAWLRAQETDRNGAGDVASADTARTATLAVWLPAGEGADTLFARLAEALRSVGIVLERAATSENVDLALVDEVAIYPQTSWYLHRLACKASEGLCDADTDTLVAEADVTADPGRRTSLLTQAEAEMTKANIYIPFGPPIRWSLVRGDVEGFAPNAWAWHPLMPLATLPK